MIIAKFVAVVLIGYLLGSIPFGVLIGKRSAKVDVRQYGSGKMGATNVLRVAGRKAAALVVIFDLLKGVLAVVFAGLIFGGDYFRIGSSAGLWEPAVIAQSLAALAAIAGHKWPVFLKFRGGRGVATFFGGMLALSWPAAIFGGAILIIVAYLTRYMSLGSILGAVATGVILVPLVTIKKFPIEYLVYALIGAIFIIVVHRDNIVRLISGTERKLGEKSETGDLASSTNLKSQDFQEPHTENMG